jgi:hypothetical protein
VWNWKTAALSSGCRVVLVTIPAIRFGAQTALRTALVELAIATLMGGFYGGIAEAFRHVQPFWKATGCAAAIVAGIQNTSEFLFHSFFRNPARGTGVLLSLGFTLVGTCVTMYLMRRGRLLTCSQTVQNIS